MAWHNQI